MEKKLRKNEAWVSIKRCIKIIWKYKETAVVFRRRDNDIERSKDYHILSTSHLSRHAIVHDKYRDFWSLWKNVSTRHHYRLGLISRILGKIYFFERYCLLFTMFFFCKLILFTDKIIWTNVFVPYGYFNHFLDECFQFDIFKFKLLSKTNIRFDNKYAWLV